MCMGQELEIRFSTEFGDFGTGSPWWGGGREFLGVVVHINLALSLSESINLARPGK